MAELKISEANKDDIAVWTNLQKHHAWIRLCKEMQVNIEAADKIINTLGFDRDKMFSERDVAILKKQAILDVINFPGTMISLLTGTGTEEVENPDAFSEANLPENDDL